MAPTVPTSMRGYVDDAVAFGGVLADFADTIPDCTWPNSVETFRQMRRHPQLAAIEKAYTLPIRRATWTVSPAGCRPEVAQLVADDLGLPVAGQDVPTAARTRGVSWPDHLRLALLSLPYGHSAFEALAEMRDGQARLVELSERLPSTISEFHTDKVGRLTGVSQTSLVGGKKAPEIRADRLLLYTREREGAAYWGSSILRPAYPGWLLSRELLRVLATSSRRFGMGVPVVRALPGTMETPAQAAAAAKLAQDARVGETGGAALPPGYVMELVGLSGGTPDTLGFLRYLDHAMSTACLAGFLDLGTTASGSRALAGEFIDLFLLAIQSEAISLADRVTRDCAARIVAWNWGDDEPVPAVHVADVGTKHEITAEALNLLLQSGALSADPGLEAQVRRMYRLPERDEVDGKAAPSGRVFEFDVQSGVMTPNERRAQIGLPPVEGGDVLRDPNTPSQPTPPAPPQTEDDEDEVFASAADQAAPPRQTPAAARRARRPQTAGQLALNIAAAGAGAGHPGACEGAHLTTPCKCGCNGTRHGESAARVRLGRIRSETIEREGRTVRLAAMNDDELANQFAQSSRDENWDAFNAIVGEMDRREQDARAFDGPQPEDHWNFGDDGPSDQEREVDARLARGWSYADAYADVYGGDAERVRQQERSSSVDRSAGETTDQAVRRSYDQYVHEQWLRAEADTNGHLLSREAQAAGIQPVDLFSGNSARARRYASEDLQRWWAANGGRTTFTQYRAQVLGRQRDRRSAERTRLQSNSRDFV